MCADYHENQFAPIYFKGTMYVHASMCICIYTHKLYPLNACKEDIICIVGVCNIKPDPSTMDPTGIRFQEKNGIAGNMECQTQVLSFSR